MIKTDTLALTAKVVASHIVGRWTYLDDFAMIVQPLQFPPEVIEKLKWYVYRLVDPRNGETFYVGKGKANRVFDHALGELSKVGDEDATSLKLLRIKSIHAAALEVGHIIHRHGIDHENVAFQIEAALIDAYPGLSNQTGGHNSGDYGVRHVSEIIAEYKAEEFEAQEPLILISIGKSFDDESKDVYDAVRGCWVINPLNAQKRKLILAHRRGIVVGAFRPTAWLPATPSNFPGFTGSEKRWGFTATIADTQTLQLYLHKRVPPKYRVKGASNPVRFIEP